MLQRNILITSLLSRVVVRIYFIIPGIARITLRSLLFLQPVPYNETGRFPAADDFDSGG